MIDIINIELGTDMHCLSCHTTLAQRDLNNKIDPNNVVAMLKRKTKPWEYGLKKYSEKAYMKRYWNLRLKERWRVSKSSPLWTVLGDVTYSLQLLTVHINPVVNIYHDSSEQVNHFVGWFHQKSCTRIKLLPFVPLFLSCLCSQFVM